MKKVLMMAAFAVLVTGVANAGDVALSLVNAGGASSDSIGEGTATYTLEVRATADLGGLALFGFDFDGPVPLANDQFTTTLSSFVKDAGLTNPAGFGGTLSGGTLLQVGGGQNTIGYTGTSPSYPTGTVVTGIGLTEETLATIVLDTSALTEAGSPYTFQISNGFANLIDPASQPSAPPYTVSAATMLAGSPTFTLSVTSGDTIPPQLTEVKSRKNHGALLGDLDIASPLGLQTGNRHIIEFRQHSATTLILSFDEPLLPATVIPANFQVCGLNSTPGSPATATLDGTGQIVTLTYANGAIPNGQANNSPGDVYVLQVLPGVTDLAGNPIDPSYDKVYFAASFGNVAKAVNVAWANVNPADRNEIAINYSTAPTAELALKYDVVIQPPAANAGKINPNDANQVALSYSATALDRVNLPVCP